MLRRITKVATIHRAPAGVDEDGYPLDKGNWEDWEHVLWPIFAVAPREYEEEVPSGRRTVTARLRVTCPVGGPRPGPDDVVPVPGLEDGGPYSVQGETQVWDNNPIVAITRFAGAVVFLERRRR